MSNLLDKPTNKFYGTLFNKNTALGKLNRAMDPAGKKIADDAIEKTTPLEAPQLEAPPTMPTSDDEAVRRARRRRIAMAQQQGGRQSTMLSNAGEARLGGD
jgi:hypothetical protein